MRRVFVISLGVLWMWLGGFSGSLGGSVAQARAKKHKFMLQILVQSSRRFALTGVRVYANNKLLGATDQFGIFVGFIKERKGKRVVIQLKGEGIGVKVKRTTRLRMRITNSRRVPEAVKMRFVIRGTKTRSSAKLYRFPIRVIALSPDRVGISRVRVYIDGKYVGRTNRYGMYVGRFRGLANEVIQVKAVGRGKDNEATQPVRLRVKRLKKTGKKQAVPVKFTAYINP